VILGFHAIIANSNGFEVGSGYGKRLLGIRASVERQDEMKSTLSLMPSDCCFPGAASNQFFHPSATLFDHHSMKHNR